ncbi:MAG: MerR family transcriptional regulator [Ginsengibacter sp.]
MSFTIKDLENLTGIKAHTLRIWEQRYNFLTPSRSTTNIRSYSNEELKVLLNISLLNKYGFKISRIDQMSEDQIKENILSFENTAAETEALSNELIKSMIEVDTQRFEYLLQKYISKNGIKDCIIKIIYPFLVRIGILWQTENINPAQEHLVSNLIRQKIITGIDQLSWPKGNAKKACLFLPEGEYHELTLLFIYYLLKNQGLEVIYIGSNTPLKDVMEIKKVTNPDFLYTHITTAGKNFNINKFIQNLEDMFSDIPVYISGNLAKPYEKKIPASINFKKSLDEVLSFIESFPVRA